MRRFFQYLIALGAAAAFFLELFFRFVVPASQHPLTIYDSAYQIELYDSLRQVSGLYVYGRTADVRGRWKVNNYGWVSEVPFEAAERRSKPMVAIIGDSYVENLYCDVQDHLDRYLEQELGGAYAVYAFGNSGCNLAQFISVSRYVRDKFQPALIVYLVNHRNLRESLTTVKRDRDQLQFAPEAGGLKRMEPVQKAPGKLTRMLSHSALYRYLRTNLKIAFDLPDLTPWDKGDGAPVLDVDNPSAEMRAHMAAVADTILSQLAKENGSLPVLYALHPHRPSIYAGDEPLRQTPDQEILMERLRQRGEPYLDLNLYFNETWKREGRKFEFPTNQHWNPYGNKVAARAIARALSASFAARQAMSSDSAPARKRLN